LNGKGTRIELRFEVGRLEEVLRWVLSFGSKAKVLGLGHHCMPCGLTISRR
jgi:hypothetical protein